MVHIKDFSTHFACVANGKIESQAAILSLLKRHTHIIAADGGLNHLHALSLTPELIIGDFDSADPKILAQYAHIPQHRYPENKDASDLELAIDAAFERGATEVTLYGALNGRTDHLLGNLLLLKKRPGKIHIESENEWITAVTGRYEMACQIGQTISLFAFDQKVEGVTTGGLKWELNGATIDSTFYSLSNVAVADRITIQAAAGVLLFSMQKPEGYFFSA